MTGIWRDTPAERERGLFFHQNYRRMTAADVRRDGGELQGTVSMSPGHGLVLPNVNGNRVDYYNKFQNFMITNQITMIFEFTPSFVVDAAEDRVLLWSAVGTGQENSFYKNSGTSTYRTYLVGGVRLDIPNAAMATNWNVSNRNVLAVAATIGGTAKNRLNGVQVGSAACGGSFSPAKSTLSVGGVSGTPPWYGTIHSVRMFDQELTAEEMDRYV